MGKTYCKRIKEGIDDINYKNIDHRDIRGNTKLIKACILDDTCLVKYLIEKKANLNIQNNKGDTALIIACKKCCNRNDHPTLELIELLVESKTDVDIQNFKGKTALFFACENYYKFSIFKSLIKQSKNLNLCDTQGNNVLMSLLNNQNNGAYSGLFKDSLVHMQINELIKYDIDLKHLDANNETILMAFIRKIYVYVGIYRSKMLQASDDDIVFIKKFIERGVDIYHQTSKNETAFTICCRSGIDNIASLLLDFYVKDNKWHLLEIHDYHFIGVIKIRMPNTIKKIKKIYMDVIIEHINDSNTDISKSFNSGVGDLNVLKIVCDYLI